MIQIPKYYRGERVGYYDIFDNADEYHNSKHKHKLKDFHDAQANDYVLTNNGYFCPVVSTSCLSKNYNTVTKKIILPLGYEWINHLNTKTKKHSMYPCYFYPHQNAVRKQPMRGTSRNIHLFTALIVNGMDIFEAYRTAYPKLQFSNTTIIQLINHPLVIESIFKQKTNMKSLFDTLQDNHLTKDDIAKYIKDIMDTPINQHNKQIKQATLSFLINISLKEESTVGDKSYKIEEVTKPSTLLNSSIGTRLLQ